MHERLRRDFRDVVVDDRAWPVMLERLADHLGANEVVLGGAVIGGMPEMVAPRTDPGHVAIYEETYHQQNALMQAVMQRGMGAVTVTDSLPEIDRFRRSDFYNLWCAPQDFNHAVALSLMSSTGWVGALVANTREPVTGLQQATFEALAPDLKWAVEQWRFLTRLRAANRQTLSVLDMNGTGAMFLDRQGLLLDCNDTAEAMLRDGRLGLRDGQLHSHYPQDDAVLSDLIARCLLRPDSSGGRLQIEGRYGPLQLQCAPFPGDMAFPVQQRPSVIVTVTDPQQKLRERLATLSRLHGLTHAETELAMAVVQTGSRKAAALARGVSDTTARTQLSSIFDKTGVRRQTELVRLLMDEGQSVSATR